MSQISCQIKIIWFHNLKFIAYNFHESFNFSIFLCFWNYCSSESQGLGISLRLIRYAFSHIPRCFKSNSLNDSHLGYPYFWYELNKYRHRTLSESLELKSTSIFSHKFAKNSFFNMNMVCCKVKFIFSIFIWHINMTLLSFILLWIAILRPPT